MLKKIVMTTIILLLLVGSGIYMIFFEQFVTTVKPEETPSPVVNDIAEPVEPATDETSELASITLTGTIVKTDRPAPDIAYDYSINLDKPHMDISAMSDGLVPTSTYYLVTDNRLTAQQIEENVGKKVTVTGRIEWGYAESRHLFVIKVN